MNIIRMSGGLERQLFQYALYMKFESMGVETKFDDINEFRDERTRPIMLSVFNIDYPRATWDEIVRYTDQSRDLGPRLRRMFGKTHTNIYSENGFYDPEVLNQRDTYIEGKFMSQKYFEDILPHVHEVYSFPDIGDIALTPHSNKDFLIYYNDIVNSNSVGIHIRRSDSRYNEELYRDICTNEYYEGAIKYINERVPDARFFVFSNEPKWVKGWLKEIIMSQVTDDMTHDEINELRRRFTLVEANDELTSYLDMFLLSKCRHNILSNSSFSWWGAWMNEHDDKIVIAPNTWINGEDCEHIYTEGMVLINPKGRVDRKIR
ncbi:MAG: alpha-1,2-fucosyltransferase [Lachnospiraceae bacterium]|nr:alpha-1,2-fucosyltransferase [Lachnospiraceae bacterium]